MDLRNRTKAMWRDRGTERSPNLEEKGFLGGENPSENEREDKVKGRGRQSERETERVELMKAQGKQKNKKKRITKKKVPGLCRSLSSNMSVHVK